MSDELASASSKSSTIKIGKPRRGKLEWLEAGRGIAAGAVVISHINTTHIVPVNPSTLGLLGTFGVAYFFVLSGFLMLHIHRNDMGHYRTLPYFIWRRVGRIIPMYYIAVITLIAINLLLQKMSSHVSLTTSFVANQVFLLPGHPLFVGQAWTLRDELFFYLVFSGLLINIRLGMSILAIWFAIMIWHLFHIGIWTSAVDGFPDLYIHHVNLYFFEGLCVAFTYNRGYLRHFLVFNIIATMCLFILSETTIIQNQKWMIAIALFPAFGALLGITVLMSVGKLEAPRFLIWLGKISYSLYLVHLGIFIVLRGVDHVIGRPLDEIWPIRVLLQLAIAVGVAGLLSTLVEQPILKWVAQRQTVIGLNVSRRRISSVG